MKKNAVFKDKQKNSTKQNQQKIFNYFSAKSGSQCVSKPHLKCSKENEILQKLIPPATVLKLITNLKSDQTNIHGNSKKFYTIAPKKLNLTSKQNLDVKEKLAKKEYCSDLLDSKILYNNQIKKLDDSIPCDNQKFINHLEIDIEHCIYLTINIQKITLNDVEIIYLSLIIYNSVVSDCIPRLQCILLGSWSEHLVDIGSLIRIVNFNPNSDIKNSNYYLNLENISFESIYQTINLSPRYTNIVRHCCNSYIDKHVPLLLILDEAHIALTINPLSPISCTNIVSGISCPRRSILNQRIITIPDPPSYIEVNSDGFCILEEKKLYENGEGFNLAYGKLAHKVFQSYIQQSVTCMTNGYIQSSEYLKNEEFTKIKSLITNSIDASMLLDVIFYDLSLESLTRKLDARIADFVDWKMRYIINKNPILSLEYPKEMCQNYEKKLSSTPKKSLAYRIKNLVTENYIESQVYGLKGFLDVTLDLSSAMADSESESCDVRAVLELKTGRNSNSIEHQAQVMLYSLLLNEATASKLDDKGSGATKGLLLYLDREQNVKKYRSFNGRKQLKVEREDNFEVGLTMIPVKTDVPRHLIGLIKIRNELAYYTMPRLNFNPVKCIANNGREHSDELFTYKSYLPKVTANEGTCQRCPQLLSCSLISKSFNDSEEGRNEIEDCNNPRPSHTNIVEHLDKSDTAYFKKWYSILHIECQALSRECKSSASSGRLDRLLCTSIPFENEFEMMEREENLAIKFRSIDAKDELCPAFVVGQKVLIECEQSKSQIMGILMSIDNGQISHIFTISIIKSDAHYKQEILKFNSSPLLCHLSVAKLYDNSKHKYDRQLSTYSLSAGLGNLTALMRPGPGFKRLRDVIVRGLAEPASRVLTPHEERIVRKYTKTLNDEQLKAIIGALTCQKYILIKGMPGSGKTKTILKLISIFRALGLSTLLTAHTNSAIDNVLCKLSTDGIHDFLRVGAGFCKDENKCNDDKIPRELRKYCLTSATIKENCVTGVEYKRRFDMGKLEQYLASHSIYAATAFTISREPLIHKMRYDVCVVDEASQISQPLILSALLRCERFVLVGDSDQLPPIIKHPLAKKLDGEQSLFASLEESATRNGSRSTLLYELNVQYRMNRTLMQLCNHPLILNGKLLSGNLEVATNTINPSILSHINDQKSDWIYRALDPDLGKAIAFLNVDGCLKKYHRRDDQSNLTTVNLIEIRVIVDLVETLIKRCHIPTSELGIIALYSAQVEALKGALVGSEIDVKTIDQFQGHEKSVIILSFVVSSRNFDASEGGTSSILKDRRRLNVAFSRARHKLIMVGSKSTLWKHYELCKTVLNTILTPDHFITIQN